MLDLENEKVKEKKNEDTDNKEILEEILKINSDEIDIISQEEQDKENYSIDSSEEEKKNREAKNKIYINNKKNKTNKKENKIINLNDINQKECNKFELSKLNKDNKEVHNSETNNNNGKYDNPPKKNFSIKSAKKINKEEIINNINNKIKIEEIYSINWLGKKYFRMTKKKDIKRLNNIYYYCINHRTLKNSTESNKKGEPKRISLCNARLIYVKDIEEFYTDWEHSSYCNNQKAQEYQNLGDINEQINNYKDLKEKLTLYLNTHSMITVGEFIKKGYKLYDKCSCKFNVENYTFKNIYYNWRKSSLSFKKYSSLEYPNTK